MSEAPVVRKAIPQAQSTASGHTQMTSRPLHITEPTASKRVCFYKSGDSQFSGLPVVINSRTFKTFEALLDSLSKRVLLPFVCALLQLLVVIRRFSLLISYIMVTPTFALIVELSSLLTWNEQAGNCLPGITLVQLVPGAWLGIHITLLNMEPAAQDGMSMPSCCTHQSG